MRFQLKRHNTSVVILFTQILIQNNNHDAYISTQRSFRVEQPLSLKAKKNRRNDGFFLKYERTKTADYFALNTSAGCNALALRAGYQVASKLKIMAVIATTTTSLIANSVGKKSTK